MLVVKNPPVSAGDIRDSGLIPGSGRSPRGGHAKPFQYSCLANPMDRGAWWAKVHRVGKSRTWLKQLSKAQNKVNIGLSHVVEVIKVSCCLLHLSVMSNSFRPHELQPARLLCPWDSSGKNTGIGCHAFLQGTFPTQESNQPLLSSWTVGRFFTAETPGKPK